MKFNVRVKAASIVAGAVLTFGVALPLVSGEANSGAAGNRSVVGGQSNVSKPPVKKPVVKKPVKKVVTTTTVHTLTVAVTFAAPSATLSASAKSQLTALAKKLVNGAVVTIYGYAKHSFSLSQRRALAVEQYLKSKTRVKLSVKLVPTFTSKNAAKVLVKQA
jgi:outer membrane protein OmpA-like peptidoglycan-associated protein